MALPDPQPLTASPPLQAASPPPDGAPQLSGPLADLRGLRTAPALDDQQRLLLREALRAALVPCSWFTIGVMAASATAAVDSLRRWEAALGWPPLQADDVATAAPGPVFLKGNQRSGHYWLRQESGLGVGVLISGHNPDDPSVEDTWGPFPLDLFD